VQVDGRRLVGRPAQLDQVSPVTRIVAGALSILRRAMRSAVRALLRRLAATSRAGERGPCCIAVDGACKRSCEVASTTPPAPSTSIVTALAQSEANPIGGINANPFRSALCALTLFALLPPPRSRRFTLWQYETKSAIRSSAEVADRTPGARKA